MERSDTRHRHPAPSRTATAAKNGRLALVTGAFALALSTLAGCGLVSGSPMTDDVRPGSVGRGEPLDGARLTVTSKEFTEQIILGQIMGIVFQAAGAQVVDRTTVQGSIGAREAVKSGTADGMYEYTGTGWITYLGHEKPIADRTAQWKAVRDEDRGHGITWLTPSTLNNTYALAVNARMQKKYSLRTLSDAAELTRTHPSAATVCAGNEFASRDDGLKGVAEKYDMRIPAGNVHKMGDGVVYEQTAKGDPCTFGAVAATDGRIQELGLKLLKDDKRFFPKYDAAPEMNSATMKEYPQIAGLLAPVTEALDNTMAQELNAKVDVEGQDPHQVALDWLLEEGFVKTG